jgi:hypothetical protein
MQLQYSNFTLVQHTASPLTAHQMQSSKRLQYCTVVSVVHTIGPTVTSILKNKNHSLYSLCVTVIKERNQNSELSN